MSSTTTVVSCAPGVRSEGSLDRGKRSGELSCSNLRLVGPRF